MLELWVHTLEEPGRLGTRRLAHKCWRQRYLWWPHTGHSPSLHPSTAGCISYGAFLSVYIHQREGMSPTMGNDVEVLTVISEQNMLPHARALTCIVSECQQHYKEDRKIFLIRTRKWWPRRVWGVLRKWMEVAPRVRQAVFLDQLLNYSLHCTHISKSFLTFLYIYVLQQNYIKYSG